MGARMFTAVLPPSTLVEELDQLLIPRRDADSRLRWSRPEGWHITTAFMASVPDVERLEEALAEVTAQTVPFEITVGSGIAFPDAHATRLLGLGIAQGATELTALAEKSRNAANRAGAGPDGSRFVGHLTLARTNRGFPAVKWLELLDSFPHWSFPVTELALIHSHQTGRRYEQVASFPLRGER